MLGAYQDLIGSELQKGDDWMDLVLVPEYLGRDRDLDGQYH